MVSTVSPKASATPRKPMPSAGTAAASTALPQPPSTSQSVPISSAASRLPNAMSPSRSLRSPTANGEAEADAKPAGEGAAIQAFMAAGSGVSGHQAAVDRDGHSGEVRGGGKAEAESHVSDLGRVAIAAQRRA